MQTQPRGIETVERLIAKGVAIPNPLSLDIGPEVDPDRISGDGVVIYPGCRIYGARTVISAGSRLGAEGPVTLDDCRLGPRVDLRAGSFADAVFLAGASMGPGAHVREGTLLEEEANGAHTVGLKQTILFPFVTLGSLINFCDCLMAGGTSRKDHSEVGSSYIHFNFTPDGHKATASLFGDVPRGVMLDRPPIFLGGQGGAVGPIRVGYGAVVAAGSILRADVAEDGTFVVPAPPEERRRPVTPHAYRQLPRIVANNVTYLANLAALRRWYHEVRRPFFEAQELGPLVYEGALEMLDLAVGERTKRLAAMVGHVGPDDRSRIEVRERIADVCVLFEVSGDEAGAGLPPILGQAVTGSAADYVATIRALPAEARAAGVGWLQQVVDDLCRRAAALLPSMDLFAGD
ncbi:MAG: UDP-N-acetylglucosamine pyrophosphorylase [Chloroflexi bacterium]|jgi:UDP-N-acetylglucosamine/UDP-N-acetylgalactosamine diphosphorylase|nr:UDP-N-acetylglucosamine pyrophosphorylase [Chloroflexota bacterium]